MSIAKYVVGTMNTLEWVSSDSTNIARREVAMFYSLILSISAIE